MERDKLILQIIRYFLRDFFISLKPFQSVDEKTDFVETLIEYLNSIASHEEPIPEFNYAGNYFDSNAFVRKNILVKYKDKAKPFVDTNFRFYFEKDPGLRQHLLKLLKIGEPALNDEEYEQYIETLHTILHTFVEKICTQSFETAKGETEKAIEVMPALDNVSGFKSTSKEYTRSRQLLMYYFMLQLLGLTRMDNSLRKYAQFGHYLFAWPVDSVDNSNVYKMLKKAPFIKENDATMLKDLEFVKSQFALIDHLEGVALIQKHIDSMKR